MSDVVIEAFDWLSTRIHRRQVQRQFRNLRHEEEILVSEIPPEELAPHLASSNFAEMVQVARALSVDFDFVRVDLSSVRGKTHFGELTCTPQQGYGVITKPKLQKLRDEMWELDAHNPRLYKAPRSCELGR